LETLSVESTQGLNEITILTPCSMDWDRMAGDDHARYCPACGKHVHDFAKMTSAQASSLLDKVEGDVCGRLTRLNDGKLLTADCTPAAEPEPVYTPWQFNIRSLMGIIAGFAATLGLGRLLADYMEGSPPPPRAALLTTTVGKVAPRPPVRTSSQNPSPGQPACPVQR
jgi:hypothetical protein